MSLLLLRGGVVGGTTTPPDVLFSDDFSSGDFTKTENGVEWIATRNMSVVNAASIGLPASPTSSTHAAKFFYDGGIGQFAQLDLAIAAAEAAGVDRLFIRYYLYFPDGTEGGSVGPAWVTSSGSIGQKWLRVYDYPTYDVGELTWACGAESFYPPNADADPPETSTKHKVFLYQGQPTAYASPGQFQSEGWSVPAGEWVEIGWDIKPNTVTASGWNVGGDGIQRLYVNGVLILETTTGSLCPAGGVIRGLYLMGNNNAAFDNANVACYMKDFAISTESMP